MMEQGTFRNAVPTFAVFAVRPRSSAEYQLGCLELVVQRLDANIGNGIVPKLCPSSLVRLVFTFGSPGAASRFLGTSSDEIRGKSRGESNVENRFPKNVFLHSGLLPMYEAAIFCRG